MKKKYEINYLSEDFFEKYDSKHFPEIEHKLNRPYLVLVLKVENNTYAICIIDILLFVLYNISVVSLMSLQRLS